MRDKRLLAGAIGVLSLILLLLVYLNFILKPTEKRDVDAPQEELDEIALPSPPSNEGPDRGKYSNTQKGERSIA